MTDAFTLHSSYQVLEEPLSACFVISLTLSRDIDAVVSHLKTTDVWRNTSHSILLVQLLTTDTVQQSHLPVSLPARVLLASPLGQLRPGYDFTLPPILSQEDLLYQVDTWSELPLLMPLQRKYLFYFSGRVLSI